MAGNNFNLSPDKKSFDDAAIKKAITSILKAIGEDPQREGLANTPRRVAEMYAELFYGIQANHAEELTTGF